MQGNYELGLVVTGLEFGEDSAHPHYLSGEVNDLAQATDDKLAGLAPLGARWKDHASDLVRTRQQWPTGMGLPIITPFVWAANGSIRSKMDEEPSECSGLCAAGRSKYLSLL